MNFKFLLGVSVFAVAIITVIAISLMEDESSLTEQEIRESIQNEISKYPKITGVHAQNICKILDFECPSNKTFQAVFDPSDEYTKFTYSKRVTVDTFATDYFFRIIDDELEYQTSRNPTEWITFVDADFDDSWMWDDDLTSNVSTQLKPYDYEDVCGYPVTDEMRLDLIYQSSWNSGNAPFEKGIGNFTHTERSLYLTDIPLLQYWFELKDGTKIYFELGVCDLDDSDISTAQMNPNYEKPQDIVIDGIHYVEFVGPGAPLIYKDTLLPVLDVDNCQRVAEDGTKKGSWKLFTYGNYDGDDTPWKNQVAPLRDYCQNIGTFELKTADGNINWSFTVK